MMPLRRHRALAIVKVATIVAMATSTWVGPAADSAEGSLDQSACFTGTGPSARDSLIHNTNPKSYAIRRGDWVLIAAKTGGVSAVPTWFDEANGYTKNMQPGELYNLREDLSQKHNRYAAEPAIVAELERLLDATVARR